MNFAPGRLSALTLLFLLSANALVLYHLSIFQFGKYNHTHTHNVCKHFDEVLTNIPL